MEIETGKDLFTIIHKGRTSAFTQFYTMFFQKLLLTSAKYGKDAFIAEEIVRTLVGSIGLLAAVPLTTLIASYLACVRAELKLPADHNEHHHRH